MPKFLRKLLILFCLPALAWATNQPLSGPPFSEHSYLFGPLQPGWEERPLSYRK